MAEEQITYNSIRPLKNVSGLMYLIERLDGRQSGLPGIGCFYGFSGLGKTYAATHAAITQQAVHVRMCSTWTQRKLCTAILFELGITPARVVADMCEQIAEALARTQRPLLIDEADFLVKRKMIEIVRDIHDLSDGAVVLIGEEQLPQKLQAWERVHGRILSWVAAEPGDLSDLRQLAALHAPDLEIEPPLLDRILGETRGSIRRMCNSLDALQEFALSRGFDHVGTAEWGTRQFFTGEAPAPRRLA